MTVQPLHRPQWAVYNTWPSQRAKGKRARRRAYRDLARLMRNAPAAVAAAQDRSRNMTDRNDPNYWSEEAMEARQQARLRLLDRSMPLPLRPRRDPEPPTRRQELLAAGLVFTVQGEDQERARLEHRARRRRAERELAAQQRLHDHSRASMRDALTPPDDAA
ncbi:hypothetical protein OG373_06760 [Streptomyces avidinii]|uniref:hypothetical protein n=1 Tax=Streptomyces avidinii TaxID=1895 RepID=UPI003868640B|nr:hypothetical protein OG373_06760 [Streptomyces avidinii]